MPHPCIHGANVQQSIRPDFLKETVPYLGEDPSIGIVQTPQFFRHREEQTWVEQGAGVTQEFFYRMVQVSNIQRRCFFCTRYIKWCAN